MLEMGGLRPCNMVGSKSAAVHCAVVQKYRRCQPYELPEVLAKAHVILLWNQSHAFSCLKTKSKKSCPQFLFIRCRLVQSEISLNVLRFVDLKVMMYNSKR